MAERCCATKTLMSTETPDAIAVRRIDETWYVKRVFVPSNGHDNASPEYEEPRSFSSREQAFATAQTLHAELETTYGVVDLDA